MDLVDARPPQEATDELDSKVLEHIKTLKELKGATEDTDGMQALKLAREAADLLVEDPISLTSEESSAINAITTLGSKIRIWGSNENGYKAERNQVMDVNEEVEQEDLDVINKVMKETGRDVMYRKKESVDMAKFLKLKTEQWMLSQVWNNPGLSTEMSEKDRIITDRMKQLNTELSDLTNTSMVPRRNTFENTPVFQRVDRLNSTLVPQTV